MPAMLTRFLRFALAACLGLGGLVLPGPARGDEGGQASPAELLPDLEERDQMVERIRRDWQLEAIESAIQNGFLSVAAALAERVLETTTSGPEQQRILNFRLQVALARGRLETAQAAADALQQAGLEVNPLLEAMLHFFSGRIDAARNLAGQIRPSQLSPADRAWLRLLEALLLARDGSSEAANQAFLRAERLAPNALLRDHFEIIRLREELWTGSVDDRGVSALRESVRSMRGERGGFEAARLLAIALNRRGEQNEAVEILSAHLAMPGLRELGLRPGFLLLAGMISGPGSTRGQLALQQLVAEGEGGRDLNVAFSLLVQAASSPAERESLLQHINTWLARATAHPLRERLLVHRAYLLLVKGSLAEAEQSAARLLELFPDSSFAAPALRLLAHVSWNLSPPRYRTAADYLNQLRSRLPAGRDSLKTGVLISDCYFLNEDFNSAANAYGAVLAEAPADLAPNVFLQLVLSELGAIRVDQAARQIDAAYGDPRLPLEVIWRAEWNLLDDLRRNDLTEAAFDRIRTLPERMTGEDPAPPELVLRMEWLAARLSLEVDRAAEAEDKARDLLAALDSPRFESLPAELLQEVESHLLLLTGEALVAQGEREAALRSFARLRERFPQSGPAILSYLVESRSESDADNLVSAQQSLIGLVDRFPASEYAPIALWEAALNAEQRGLVIHLQEAISILERLVTDYPAHGLVYHARLKQGDLARRMNDFPTALLIYENLLSQFPDHAERYRAEISRADCLMAIGSDDPSRLDAAAIAYERVALLSNAPLPVRMESGFKWAHSLQQQGDRDGSESVLWLLHERFVLDPDRSSTLLAEAAGRYWTARALLELASRQVDRGEIAAAERIYRRVATLDLPGAALAASRLNDLR
jgi:cellulose synthase operon protein C